MIRPIASADDTRCASSQCDWSECGRMLVYKRGLYRRHSSMTDAAETPLYASVSPRSLRSHRQPPHCPALPAMNAWLFPVHQTGANLPQPLTSNMLVHHPVMACFRCGFTATQSSSGAASCVCRLPLSGPRSHLRRTCRNGVCRVPHRAPVPAHADLSEPLLVAAQAVSKP